MKYFLKILIFYVICLSLKSFPYVSAANLNQSPCQSLNSLSINVYIRSAANISKYQHIICISEKKKIDFPQNNIPDSQKSFAYDFLEKKKQHNESVYEEILKNFESKDSNKNQEIIEIISWINRSTTWGSPQAEFIVASPDGNYAVFAPFWNKPTFLINVKNLATFRLLNDGGDPVTPVVWSPDSRYIALTQPKSGELLIFDTEISKFLSTITNEALRARALSWSPEGNKLALITLKNRRMSKNPFSIIAAASGHPVFKNDAYLSIYGQDSKENFSVLLQSRLKETETTRFQFEWK